MEYIFLGGEGKFCSLNTIEIGEGSRDAVENSWEGFTSVHTLYNTPQLIYSYPDYIKYIPFFQEQTHVV